MKHRTHKNIAAGMACLMLASCLSGCGAVPVQAEPEVPSEAEQITQAAATLLRSHSGEMGKEETVYVIASPDGSPEETIVSAWLKNPDGDATITDRAELSDIENVKGNETYTVNENGELVWQANGSDIYYQGLSEQALPVTTEISYTLDGKAVSAEELAGANGHLVITFTYKNNMASEQVIDGKTVTLYQPFMVVSGLVLDNEKASDVTVTNGKVINTGDQSVVVGMAMPGLAESLGLDTLEDADGEPVTAEIPESVTVEADVADFSLLTTVTIIENSLLNDLQLDEVDSLDDLQDAIYQLTDASSQLVNGTSERYDGVSTLSEGSGTLSDGVNALDSGAGDLKSGAAALADGTRQVADGAAELNGGVSALSDGAQQVSDGANALKSGAADLNDGAAQVSSGAQSLYTGLDQMKRQVSGLPDSVDTLYNGTAAVKSALETRLYEGAEAIEAGAGKLSAGLESIGNAAGGIKDAAGVIRTSAGNIADLLASIETDENAEAIGAISSYLAEIQTNAGTISAYAGGISDGAEGIASGSAELKTGADQLSAGAGSLKAGLGDAATVLGNIADGLFQMSESSQTLVGGVNQLADGAAALSTGAESAAKGAKQLAEGTDSLSVGASSLAEGAAALQDGSATLAAGASDAASGAGSLADGASALKDGTAQLKDGGAALIEGISQLLAGAQELKDGMAQFDNDGIQRLSAVLEDNGQALIDRLRALQTLSGEYTSFAGAGGTLPGSVRFIVRTNSIDS